MLDKIAKGLFQLIFAGALLVAGFFVLMHFMKPSAEISTMPSGSLDHKLDCSNNSRHFMDALKDGYSTKEYWKPGVQDKVLYSVSDYRLLSSGRFVNFKLVFYTFEVSSSTQAGIPIRKRWDIVMDENATNSEGNKCAIVNIRDAESDDPVIPDAEIKTEHVPSDHPTPMSSPVDGNEFSCTMIDDYKYGMTLDDFRASHYKKYSSDPSCQITNGGGQCKGHIALGNIHGIGDFLFDEGKLFAIGGSFDPREFSTVKNVFIDKFGEPSGIGVCRHPALNVSSGCEDLAWSKYGAVIMLHENYVNGDQFQIFPPMNGPEHKNYSSCPVAFITRDK